MIGTVVALTDQNGVVQTQYTYGPFGQTASSGAASDNPYAFAGRELDPNGGFGIYYFRARYYDSLELNCFMARDPNGLSGGNYASLYAYVGNSPLNGTDPTGQFGLPGVGGAWDQNDVDFELSMLAAADPAEVSAAVAANSKSQQSDSPSAQGGSGLAHQLAVDATGALTAGVVGKILDNEAADFGLGIGIGAFMSGDYSPQGMAAQFTAAASGSVAVGILDGSTFSRGGGRVGRRSGSGCCGRSRRW